MPAPPPDPARALYDSLPALLDALAASGMPTGRVGGWRRDTMVKHAESLSGSPFEWAYAGGQRYVVKHVARDLDWLMRVLDDGVDGRLPWALAVWRDGLLDRLPPVFDHAVVGAAYDATSGRGALVMRDVGAVLIEVDAGTVPLARHRRLLSHMAALHATFWGYADPGRDLLAPARRYTFADPARAARVNHGYADAIPGLFGGGWAAVAARDPAAGAVARALTADPEPLVRAQQAGPVTLVHGDWKYGNLGSHPDGRTVLLDWGWPGSAPPLVDLAWYLAVNCDLLPESKEDTIAAYRDALAGTGVDPGGWWDRQLDLALLGGYLQLGWSKAHDEAELNWWAGRAVRTAATL